MLDSARVPANFEEVYTILSRDHQLALHHIEVDQTGEALEKPDQVANALRQIELSDILLALLNGVYIKIVVPDSHLIVGSLSSNGLQRDSQRFFEAICPFLLKNPHIFTLV